MKESKTSRGFKLVTFNDLYDSECSLQESSLLIPAIWLGINDPNPQCLVNGEWVKVELPEGTVVDTRMHLTQEQVKELLPYLLAFVENDNGW